LLVIIIVLFALALASCAHVAAGLSLLSSLGVMFFWLPLVLGLQVKIVLTGFVETGVVGGGNETGPS